MQKPAHRDTASTGPNLGEGSPVVEDRGNLRIISWERIDVI